MRRHRCPGCSPQLAVARDLGKYTSGAAGMQKTYYRMNYMKDISSSAWFPVPGHDFPHQRARDDRCQPCAFTPKASGMDSEVYAQFSIQRNGLAPQCPGCNFYFYLPALASQQPRVPKKESRSGARGELAMLAPAQYENRASRAHFWSVSCRV